MKLGRFAKVSLGFSVSSVDSKCWLNGHNKENNPLTILVLPDKNIFDSECIKAILTSLKSPYLIIFFSPLSDEVLSIMKASSDCCRWPCDPLELSFRLNRMSPKLTDLYHLDKPCVNSVQWEKLSLVGQLTLNEASNLKFIRRSNNFLREKV